MIGTYGSRASLPRVLADRGRGRRAPARSGRATPDRCPRERAGRRRRCHRPCARRRSLAPPGRAPASAGSRRRRRRRARWGARARSSRSWAPTRCTRQAAGPAVPIAPVHVNWYVTSAYPTPQKCTSGARRLSAEEHPRLLTGGCPRHRFDQRSRLSGRTLTQSAARWIVRTAVRSTSMLIGVRMLARLVRVTCLPGATGSLYAVCKRWAAVLP